MIMFGITAEAFSVNAGCANHKPHSLLPTQSTERELDINELILPCAKSDCQEEVLVLLLERHRLRSKSTQTHPFFP